MMAYDYIEVRQPIGEFYLCSIPAIELIGMIDVQTKGASPEGVQRQMSSERVRSISGYCTDPDAVFPTPIVVNVYDGKYMKLDCERKKIFVEEGHVIGDVIDGQHRLWGIKNASNVADFMLPVVFMFHLTIEEKAYVFSTVNSNQRRVDPSLIFDLFEVSKHRSPYKTLHYIARAMNSNPNSPFYKRLKMLGNKSEGQAMATLSQGTFVKNILPLISMTPQEDMLVLKRGEAIREDFRCPLRQFFIKDQDAVISKILLNCFSALKEVFPDEWDNPRDNILWKTTGFIGVTLALRKLLNQGLRERQLTLSFFKRCFEAFKASLSTGNIQLTSASFPGGGVQNQKKLANMITCAIERMDMGEEEQESLVNKAGDFDEFKEQIGDMDRYELFDTVCALQQGNAPYDTLIVRTTERDTILTHRYSEASFSIPNTERARVVKYIENRYMLGMDADSWFGYMEQMDKDD